MLDGSRERLVTRPWRSSDEDGKRNQGKKEFNEIRLTEGGERKRVRPDRQSPWRENDDQDSSPKGDRCDCSGYTNGRSDFTIGRKWRKVSTPSGLCALAVGQLAGAIPNRSPAGRYTFSEDEDVWDLVPLSVPGVSASGEISFSACGIRSVKFRVTHDKDAALPTTVTFKVNGMKAMGVLEPLSGFPTPTDSGGVVSVRAPGAGVYFDYEIRVPDGSCVNEISVEANWNQGVADQVYVRCEVISVT